MTTFHLTVVTPDGCAFDGQAERVVCRAIDGDLAILAKHGDYCTALGMGEDAVRDMVEQKFGIRLEPMNTTWDDYVQKIQAWAAANSLPDIFSIDAICTPNYYAWIADEVVRPLPADLSAYPSLMEYLDVDDIQALLPQKVGSLLGSIAAQDDQAVQAQLVVGVLHGLHLVQPVFIRCTHQFERLTGGSEYRSASGQDSREIRM